MRLAAGVCPDPLGEILRSPRAPSRYQGEGGKGKGRVENSREGEKGEGHERVEKEGKKKRGMGRGER